ncbi:hypothetical protein NB539_09425 [Vibrio parahaemolyticus]|nr:hypothetical protein [Vibrio parahaemolyticus]MCS0032381.1 hypothetical protein [Vibrio parahaemolyticus]
MTNLNRFILISNVFFCPLASAGGLYLYEVTAGDIGLASAGMAARAQGLCCLNRWN